MGYLLGEPLAVFGRLDKGLAQFPQAIADCGFLIPDWTIGMSLT